MIKKNGKKNDLKLWKNQPEMTKKWQKIIKKYKGQIGMTKKKGTNENIFEYTYKILYFDAINKVSWENQEKNFHSGHFECRQKTKEESKEI